MTIEQMRAELLRLYRGDAWKKKVAAMTEQQVLAVYNRQIKGRRYRR